MTAQRKIISQSYSANFILSAAWQSALSTHKSFKENRVVRPFKLVFKLYEYKLLHPVGR